MSFGNRLKYARESKKLSQQELANLINVTDGAISNYEKGVAFPRWDTMKKLCDVLYVDPNYLFWDDLGENLKIKIIKQTSSDVDDTGFTLYKSLDETDRAEIRGEIKQMLKAEKYTRQSKKVNAVSDFDLAADITDTAISAANKNKTNV